MIRNSSFAKRLSPSPSHRFRDAEQALADLLASGLREPGIVYNLAYARFSDKRPGEAKELLAANAELLTPIATWRTCWYVGLHHLGEVEAGLAEAETQVREHLDNADAMELAALLCADLNRSDEAQKWSTEALSRNLRGHEALVAAGTVALNRQNGDAARAFFERSLAVRTDDGRA